MKPGMLLQHTQGHHRADAKFLLGFLDGVQPQTRQVNGGTHVDFFHFQPQHTADDAVCFFLVELIGFLQTFGFFVFSYRHHKKLLPFRCKKWTVFPFLQSTLLFYHKICYNSVVV